MLAISVLTISLIVLLLISGKTTPLIAMTLVPLVTAELLGFSNSQISQFYLNGLNKVMPVAVMFLFSILFFCIMQEKNLFTPLINGLLKFSQHSVISVTIATVLIAAIAHLDGSGASTFLICVPALLPLYKKLRITPYLLFLLISLSASIINMVPWGGPVGRAASVIGVDPIKLWYPLIPLQFIALILLIVLAAFLGYRQQFKSKLSLKNEKDVYLASDNSFKFDRQYLFNCILTILCFGFLMSGTLPSAFIFTIGFSCALLLNYPKPKQQIDFLNAHAANALLMTAVILSVGVFLGILQGSGMLTSMADNLVYLLPHSWLPHLHVIIGMLGAPLELVFNTDTFYYALLPVVERSIAPFDISATSTVYALLIGNIIGSLTSPFSSALWLGLGLANLDMGTHIKYSFFWVWGFSLTLLAIAHLMSLY